MNKSRYDLECIVDRMIDILGAKELVFELARAMTTDELEDYLSFISRMNDLDLIGMEDKDYV